MRVSIAFVMAALFSFGPQGRPIGAPAPVSAGTQQWTEVTSTMGGFRVMFPGSAAYQVQDVPTELGTLKMHCWLLDVGQSGYAVLYGDYTATHVQTVGAETVLANAIRGLGQSWQPGSSFERETPLVLAGYPGREYMMEAGGFINKGRTLLVGTRLWQILARAPAAQRASAMPDIDRFLTSFAIIATPK